MLWKLLVALWALTLVTLITATLSDADAGLAVRTNGTQQQIARPKFEDIKLQTGMGANGSSAGTVRDGGYSQVRNHGG